MNGKIIRTWKDDTNAYLILQVETGTDANGNPEHVQHRVSTPLAKPDEQLREELLAAVRKESGSQSTPLAEPSHDLGFQPSLEV